MHLQVRNAYTSLPCQYLMALLIVASAVYGLYWASQKGQLQNLEEGAKVIFDHEEPIGRPTDQILNQPKTAKPLKT
jgi:nitrogen fixation-related uncharacterized protein